MGQDGQILSRLLKIKPINLYLLERRQIKTEKQIKLIQIDLKKKVKLNKRLERLDRI